MNKKSYRVAFANSTTRSISYDIIKEWKPTKISRVGSNIYFNIDGTYVSMSISDYKEIFE